MGRVGKWETKRIPSREAFELKRESIFGPWFGEFTISNELPQISDGWRSELKDPMEVLPGARILYQFETRFPRDHKAESNDNSVVVAQWHDQKTNNIPSQRPQLSLRTVGNELHFYLWNDRVFEQSCEVGACGESEGQLIYSEPLKTNHWYRFEVMAKWSGDSDGYLKIKVDGVPVVHYRGPTTYRNDVFGPYFKFGIYTVHDFEGEMKVQHRKYLSRCFN